MSVAPSCLGKSVVDPCVVGGLGAGVLRLGCFGSRQCARSRDRCGCRSGGSGTLLLSVSSLPAWAEVWSASVVRGLRTGV
jgi:hypothetical protein